MAKKLKRAKKRGVAKKASKKSRSRAVAGKVKAVRTKKPVDSMIKVGEVTHYFPHVKAAAFLVLKDSIKVGDAIYIKGHTTDFKEKIKSIQLDRVPIQEGIKGQEIGLLVKKRVRIGDNIYKL